MRTPTQAANACLSALNLSVLLLLVTPGLSAQNSFVFNGPRDYVVGTSPDSVVVGDFNGDGRPDVAVANENSNSISVLLQNSDGTFQTAVSYAVGHSPTALQIGDVNGDGKLDLLVLNYLDNTLGVLLGNGDGTFQAQKLTAIAATNTLAVGDFNGDGKLDAAITVSLPQVGTYGVAVLLGNGDGTFQPAVSYPVNGLPAALAAADFNHDGKLDLVSLGSDITVLLGNGDGTFKTVSAGSFSSAPLRGWWSRTSTRMAIWTLRPRRLTWVAI